MIRSAPIELRSYKDLGFETEGTVISKYWSAEDERRQREAKAKEAEAKRTETVKAMLANAEKQVRQPEGSKLRENAPAK